MVSNPTYDDDDMVTVEVGAMIAGVHPNTLRRWADAQLLPSYRTPSNHRRFKVADLRDTLKRSEPDAAPEPPDRAPAARAS